MRPAQARGFTYIGLLLAVALFGIALAAVGQVWHTTLQRQKERELLYIGDAFRRAITAYYDGTPGSGARQYPKSLEDLLLDRRYPLVRRHLRRIYTDPFTGKAEWGLIKGPGDTIAGVYSLSRQAPLKKRNFPEEYGQFEDAKVIADWRFSHGAGAGTPATPAAATPGKPPAAAATNRPIPTANIINRGPLQPLQSTPGFSPLPQSTLVPQPPDQPSSVTP